MDRWEYHATLLYADSDRADAFLAERFPGWKPDKHSPEALIPALNAFGAEGWELVSIEPVYPGLHSDIAHGSGQAQWSAWYLCAFRRRLQASDAGIPAAGGTAVGRDAGESA